MKPAHCSSTPRASRSSARSPSPRTSPTTSIAAVNFSRFKTYTWVRGTNLTDELNHNRVVNAIDSQLVSKGITKIESGASPDLLVAYHASFDKDLQITGFSSGWGGYRFAGTRTGTARAEEILVGTLGVDLVDAHDARPSCGAASRRRRSTSRPHRRSATRTSRARRRSCSRTIPRRVARSNAQADEVIR